MLGHVGIGSGDELAPLGELGAGAPHLLAVDDPLVAVANGPAAERGEVRAGRRLGEELAAVDLGPQQRPDEPLPRWRVAELTHGRGDELGGDAEQLVAPGCLVLGFEPGEGAVVLSVEAEAAVLDRPGDGVVAALARALRFHARSSPSSAASSANVREWKTAVLNGSPASICPADSLRRGRRRSSQRRASARNCLEVRTGHEQ